MAASPLALVRATLLRCFKTMYSLRTSPFCTHSFPLSLTKPFPSRLRSTTSTPHPHHYEMIISQASNPPHPPSFPSRCHLTAVPNHRSAESEPDLELGFEDWVDKKLSNENKSSGDTETDTVMDKAKRKYYNKRRKECMENWSRMRKVGAGEG
ncbi:haca ribonucleo complex subunit 4 [Olea europaea subsp. europaea]|uniref:Haca ribonucleo complex subunit 4 n=1 Tax=Olea europaea subsp. europaea TaxID=158383 RepID=A0A8S0UCA3_OLEEU|nr:haca ribonucleo complex subunit 4 [Olea europaea subsp. europaea]